MYVGLHGVEGNSQSFGDLLVCQALADEAEYLPLAVGQAVSMFPAYGHLEDLDAAGHLPLGDSTYLFGQLTDLVVVEVASRSAVEHRPASFLQRLDQHDARPDLLPAR